MRYVILAIVLCASSFGQSAKVIQLSKEDAAKAKALHEAAVKAQEAETEFRKSVAQKYLALKQRPEDGRSACSALMKPVVWGAGGGSGLMGSRLGTITPSNGDKQPDWVYSKFGDGYTCGEFEYSEDYLFIVPMPEPPRNNSWPSGCIVASGLNQ